MYLKIVVVNKMDKVCNITDRYEESNADSYFVHFQTLCVKGE